MTQPRLSTTAVGIVLAVVALGFYGLTKLYGAWIDGRRKAGRAMGQRRSAEDDEQLEARDEDA